MMNELRNAIARFLVRGILTSAVETGSPFMRLQARGLHGEVLPNVHFIQPYGLVSNPEDGAQVMLLEVGGARDHVIGLMVSDEANRPTNLAKGEAALHGKGYVAVRAKVNGDVVIEGLSGGAVITVDASGNISIAGGTVEIGPDTTIDSKVFLDHTHDAGALLDSTSSPCTGATGAVV